MDTIPHRHTPPHEAQHIRAAAEPGYPELRERSAVAERPEGGGFCAGLGGGPADDLPLFVDLTAALYLPPGRVPRWVIFPSSHTNAWEKIKRPAGPLVPHDLAALVDRRRGAVARPGCRDPSSSRPPRERVGSSPQVSSLRFQPR